jgi:hypothetical protein
MSGSPETCGVFGKRRCLWRPAKSPGIGGADEAVGRYPQTTGFAVWADDLFHGQADRPAAEAEGGADHLGDFLEGVVAVLCKEERPSRGLLQHEKVEISVNAILVIARAKPMACSIVALGGMDSTFGSVTKPPTSSTGAFVAFFGFLGAART